jgi:hypothetical protein
MRALTVQQPWAWAIVHGGKDVENRTQAWGYRGPLAIHAGQRWSERGGRSGLIWDALRDRFGWPTGPESARRDRRPGFEVIRPIGAIIGVVDLVDVHLAQGETHAFGDTYAAACCDSPWAEQSYDEHGGRTRRDVVHLVLESPRPLEVPIPCRGALGLWTVPAGVEDQVQAQLEKVQHALMAWLEFREDDLGVGLNGEPVARAGGFTRTRRMNGPRRGCAR